MLQLKEAEQVPIETIDWNTVTYLIMARAFAGMLPMFFGLLVFIAVFSMDFKAKTMQVAIGTGLSRAEVVLAKTVEVFVITVAGIFLFGVVELSAGGGDPCQHHQ